MSRSVINTLLSLLYRLRTLLFCSAWLLLLLLLLYQVGVMFLDDKEKQSGETQGKVDDEVRLLLSDSYSRAKKLLETHRKELDLVAQVNE